MSRTFCASARPSICGGSLALVLGAMFLAVGSPAAELTGTSTSLTYRGPAVSVEKPGRGQRIRIGPTTLELPGTSSDRAPRGVLRLVVPSTGRELATARYDAHLGGFFFQMPVNHPLGSAPLCLAIRGVDGRTLPLRAESSGDDGFEFRHVPWEEALRAKAGIGALQDEMTRFQRLQVQEKEERRQLHQALGFSEGAAPPVCQLGPAQPEPPQPAWAVPEATAAIAGQSLCQFSLARTLASRGGVLAARAGELLAAAGLNRMTGSSEHSLLPPPDFRTPISQDLAVLIERGIQAGPRSLELEQGLEGLRGLHGACSQGIRQFAAAENLRWAQEREAAVRAPQTAKANCEQRLSRLAQLNEARAKGQAYQQALERKLQAAQGVLDARPAELALDQMRCP